MSKGKVKVMDLENAAEHVAKWETEIVGGYILEHDTLIKSGQVGAHEVVPTQENTSVTVSQVINRPQVIFTVAGVVVQSVTLDKAQELAMNYMRSKIDPEEKAFVIGSEELLRFHNELDAITSGQIFPLMVAAAMWFGQDSDTDFKATAMHIATGALAQEVDSLTLFLAASETIQDAIRSVNEWMNSEEGQSYEEDWTAGEEHDLLGSQAVDSDPYDFDIPF